MLKKTFMLSILAIGALLAAGCAEMNQPFADPADSARNKEVRAAMGEEYTRTVHATTVGGRVYLEGWVLNTAEKNDVIARVKNVTGVNEVVDNLQLEEVGSFGDDVRWD